MERIDGLRVAGYADVGWELLFNSFGPGPLIFARMQNGYYVNHYTRQIAKNTKPSNDFVYLII